MKKNSMLTPIKRKQHSYNNFGPRIQSYQSYWRKSRTLHTDKRVSSQEDITILKVYAPNKRMSNCKRQKMIEQQGEID